MILFDDSPEMKLRYVRIYFYATTFDKITKDRAAKFVDMLSAIGGTMGLLTGLSIISGVEIVYFGINIIFELLRDKLSKKDLEQIAFKNFQIKPLFLPYLFVFICFHLYVEFLSRHHILCCHAGPCDFSDSLSKKLEFGL